MSFSSDPAPQGRSVHEQVIYAVANANGVAPTDLEPLYHTIDPEALDALFDDGGEGTISFRYAGHDVVVHADGAATVDGTEVDVTPFQALGVGDDSSASATGR